MHRVAVTHEHRRAKTDRLDTELLIRGFLGWPARRRARYFAFRGGKWKRAQRSAAIAELIKPYPRRGVLAQSRSLPSGSQMLLHLTEFQ
jgi:hypothetical protein